MAARATRSASRKARLAEAVATGPLGALSHDELGVIFEGLAEPLQPVVAVALSSTCLGLRTPLQAALKVLQEQHTKVRLLCFKMGSVSMNPAVLRDHTGELNLAGRVTANDMATLGMILRTNGLPRVQYLYLYNNYIGDTATQALFEDLGPRSLPSLVDLDLEGNNIGPTGAEALAAALRSRAMPMLQALDLNANALGNQGAAAIAPPLRKLPALESLILTSCEIGDEGVSSLFSDLGKDEFRKLEYLEITDNELTDEGCATLAVAIKNGAMPRLLGVELSVNPASDEAREAVQDALVKAKACRA